MVPAKKNSAFFLILGFISSPPNKVLVGKGKLGGEFGDSGEKVGVGISVWGGGRVKEGQVFGIVFKVFLFKGFGRGEVGAVRGFLGIAPRTVFLGKEQF